ncbi:MAG: DUF4255 domain-containing protein [Ktedonobacteraceae bacterium]
MATYRAVEATSEAVMRLLQQSWRRDLFENRDLLFQVYQTQDFATPMSTGVSLFLYRVTVNTIQRTPVPRPGPKGRLRRPQLPLDLHFLLTPWADHSSLAQAILGWMMRAIEDTAILPAGLLNAVTDGVFDDDETVEIVAGQMTNEEMFRIWDVLPRDYQISIPYTARIVRIDSNLDLNEAGPVLAKDLDFGVLKDL